MSNAQYAEGQQITIIDYCRVCSALSYGYPGSKQELCNIHQQEVDLIETLRRELIA